MDVILQASLALLAAALTGKFAVETYFRQREHELIIERYLEGGLDLLSSELERIITTFNYNWARCLAILGSFRDLKDNFDVTELQRGFLDLQASNYNSVAHQRLFTLTAAGDYWIVYQAATAHFTSAKSVLVRQIPEVIRVKLTTNQIDRPHAEIAEEGFLAAKKEQDASHKYVQLVNELQFLSAALESERLRFSDLKYFAGRSAVKESLDRMRKHFPEELSQ